MADGRHNGYNIEVRIARESHPRQAAAFFNVMEGDEDVFQVVMRVRGVHPLERGWGEGRDSGELAAEHGLLWTRGLIDLGRFERGARYVEDRDGGWDPLFGEDNLTDEDLRLELLRALRLVYRKQVHAGAVLEIDVEGIATVLGVTQTRLKELLSELILAGLVEPNGYGSYGHGPEDGACRLTAAGLRAVTESERASTLGARLVTVDDIDSFERVRQVDPESVRELLNEGGVLKLSEAQVKTAMQEIVGELHDHRDWGGERSDVFTTQLRFEGRRVPAAMLLKGPGVRSPVLHLSHLGARGDQALRLFGEPAVVFIIQFNGKIDSLVNQNLEILASYRAMQGKPTVVCIMDGTDTARLLRAYGHV